MYHCLAYNKCPIFLAVEAWVHLRKWVCGGEGGGISRGFGYCITFPFLL